ncbi:ATP-dependent RNA helicase DbpA [Legionella sp. CNM-4043-24]|uniref:ATP-dependent RNA helicase DbpA n=1 Tax=Legionella sp. CNM-4043-24 TaxID=3421646 RepID=UPI00403A8586
MTQHSEHETAFSSLPLRDELLKSLESLQYQQMTPIQQHSLPVILQQKDVLAQAKTGSGKTTAFGLPILHRLKLQWFAVQALILCPTRELAEQVSQALRRLACFLPNVKIVNLSGGIPMRPQEDSLKHGAHIVVGTPGRVQKHLDKGSLTLAGLTTLVLDEADRMLDMGFLDDMKVIMSLCPKQRQTLLFSATWPDEIRQISQQFMQNPEDIRIEETQARQDIEQRFFEVPRAADKFSVLQSLLYRHRPESTLIFCNTRQQVADLADRLIQAGFSATALHGDMEQPERDLAMLRFTNRSSSILVATDVAARGLDIKELPVVINYELAFERDVHTHRVGRTGRAGHQGLAFSLTVPGDAQRVLMIEEAQANPVVWGKPEELKAVEKMALLPQMQTLCLFMGKKDKIRAGDILGALTKDAGLPADCVGKIDITPFNSYVAIHRSQAKKAWQYLQNGKLKGRRVQAKILS